MGKGARGDCTRVWMGCLVSIRPYLKVLWAFFLGGGSDYSRMFHGYYFISCRNSFGPWGNFFKGNFP